MEESVQPWNLAAGVVVMSCWEESRLAVAEGVKFPKAYQMMKGWADIQGVEAGAEYR